MQQRSLNAIRIKMIPSQLDFHVSIANISRRYKPAAIALLVGEDECLNDKESARSEVTCRIPEDLELDTHTAGVEYAVENEHGEPELTDGSGLAKIANSDRNSLPSGFLAQLVHHRLGTINSSDTQSLLAQRQRHTTCPNPELDDRSRRMG